MIKHIAVAMCKINLLSCVTKAGSKLPTMTWVWLLDLEFDVTYSHAMAWYRPMPESYGTSLNSLQGF